MRGVDHRACAASGRDAAGPVAGAAAGDRGRRLDRTDAGLARRAPADQGAGQPALRDRARSRPSCDRGRHRLGSPVAEAVPARHGGDRRRLAGQGRPRAAGMARSCRRTSSAMCASPATRSPRSRRGSLRSWTGASRPRRPMRFRPSAPIPGVPGCLGRAAASIPAIPADLISPSCSPSACSAASLSCRCSRSTACWLWRHA